MVRFKIDILDELKKAGWNRTKLNKTRIISSMTIQHILDRTRLQNLPAEEIAADPRLSKKSIDDIMLPNLESLNTICIMLGKQISDIIEIVPTDEEIIKVHRMKMS